MAACPPADLSYTSRLKKKQGGIKREEREKV